MSKKTITLHSLESTLDVSSLGVNLADLLAHFINGDREQNNQDLQERNHTMLDALKDTAKNIQGTTDFHAIKDGNQTNRSVGITEESFEEVQRRFSFLKNVSIDSLYKELNEKERYLLGILSIPAEAFNDNMNNIEKLIMDTRFVEAGFDFVESTKNLSRPINGESFGERLITTLNEAWENINFADLVAYAYTIYSSAIVSVEKSTNGNFNTFDITYLNPYKPEEEINKCSKGKIPTELYVNAIPFTPFHFDENKQMSIPVAYIQLLRFIEYQVEESFRNYILEIMNKDIVTAPILLQEAVTMMSDIAVDSRYLILEDNEHLNAICNIQGKPLLSYVSKILLLSKAHRLVEIFEHDYSITYENIEAYRELAKKVERHMVKNHDKKPINVLNSIYANLKNETSSFHEIADQFLLDFFHAEGDIHFLQRRYERIEDTYTLYKYRFDITRAKTDALMQRENVEMSINCFESHVKEDSLKSLQVAQQMTQMKKEVEKSEKKVGHQKAEIDELKEKIKAFRAQIKELTKSKGNSSTQANSNINRELQEKLKLAETQKMEAEKQLDALTKDMEEQLNLKEHLLKKANETISSLKSENESLAEKAKTQSPFSSLPVPSVSQPIALAKQNLSDVSFDTWLSQGSFLLNGSNRKDYEFSILNFIKSNFDIKELVEDESLKEVATYTSRVGYAVLEDNKHMVVFANGEKKLIHNLPHDTYLGAFQFIKVDSEDNFIEAYPSMYRERLNDKYHDFGVVCSSDESETVFTVMNDEEVRIPHKAKYAKLKTGQVVSYNRFENTFMAYQIMLFSLDTFFESISAKNQRIVVFKKQLSNGGIFYDLDTESETFLNFGEEDVFNQWDLKENQVVVFDKTTDKIVKVFNSPLFFKLSSFYKNSMIVTIESIESSDRIFVKNNIGEIVLLKQYPSHFNPTVGDIILVDEDFSYLRYEKSDKYIHTPSVERKILSNNKNNSAVSNEKKAELPNITHKVLIFGNPSYSNSYQVGLRKNGFDATLVDGYENINKSLGILNKSDIIVICNDFSSHENMFEVKDLAKSKGIPVLYPKKDGASFISMTISDFVSKNSRINN